MLEILNMHVKKLKLNKKVSIKNCFKQNFILKDMPAKQNHMLLEVKIIFFNFKIVMRFLAIKDNNFTTKL